MHGFLDVVQQLANLLEKRNRSVDVCVAFPRSAAIVSVTRSRNVAVPNNATELSLVVTADKLSCVHAKTPLERSRLNAL